MQNIDYMKTFSKEQVAQSLVDFLTTKSYIVTTKRKTKKNGAVVAYKQQAQKVTATA